MRNEQTNTELTRTKRIDANQIMELCKENTAPGLEYHVNVDQTPITIDVLYALRNSPIEIALVGEGRHIDIVTGESSTVDYRHLHTPNKTVQIHNHPNGYSRLSLGDIINMDWFGQQTIGLIIAQHNIHVYKRPQEGWAKDALAVYEAQVGSAPKDSLELKRYSEQFSTSTGITQALLGWDNRQDMETALGIMNMNEDIIKRFHQQPHSNIQDQSKQTQTEWTFIS